VTVSGTVRGDLVWADTQSSQVSPFFYANNPSGNEFNSTEMNFSAALTSSFNLQQSWVLVFGVG
jgi:hypothetical protein